MKQILAFFGMVLTVLIIIMVGDEKEVALAVLLFSGFVFIEASITPPKQ